MAINNLITVLTPPSNPSRSEGKQGWLEIEEMIGSQLPTDYKQFIDLYGTGGIDDFLWILTPFVNDENVNLFNKVKIINKSIFNQRINIRIIISMKYSLKRMACCHGGLLIMEMSFIG